MELLSEWDAGEPVTGKDTGTFLYGEWKNVGHGSYIAGIRKSVKKYILITDKRDISVALNLENESSTESLFDAIREKWMEKRN